MKKNKIYIFVIILLFFINCKNEIKYIPEMQGNAIGYTKLYNYGGEATDFSGINVKIEGLNYNNEIITDINGKYEFLEIPSGTYKITYYKEGYGTMINTGCSLLGGDFQIIEIVRLIKIPNIDFNNININSIGKINANYLVNDYTANPQAGIAFLFYFNDNEVVDSENYLFYEYIVNSDFIDLKKYSNLPTKLYTKVYIIYPPMTFEMRNGYFYSNTYFDDGFYYLNTNNGKTIFPNINQSVSKNFVYEF